VKAARRSDGVPLLERVEAILRNPAIYRLAEEIPQPDASLGGRPRTYPAFMWVLFEALLSVYGSARQVEAELSHPLIWRFIRTLVDEQFPDEACLHLPPEPMRRHHYLYGRNRYLADPPLQEALLRVHREISASHARELGLMEPDGAGSWSHPHLDRLLYADGKVIAPLYRAKRGESVLDAATGELRELRAEPDAGLHFEGTGQTAYGVKFVLVAARSADEHGRIILDLDWVPNPGGETDVAMRCFRRLIPLLPGAQAIVYDTALRGVHHQEILRDLGLIPINRVTAHSVSRSGKKARRVEKSRFIEDKEVTLPGGEIRRVKLYSRGGAVGIVEFDDRGEPLFTELRRVKTHRARGKNGPYRWYNEYALPTTVGAKTVTVRLDTTHEDRARRFNRTENVRVIPPTDPNFEALFRRRNDVESINRGVDDSLYLGRAHSLGHARQLTNLLGYALMVNSLALHRHRARAPAPESAAA
jgi:hypothetical protein